MTGREKETRTYKMTGTPAVLDRIERFLSMLHLNGAWGHSGTFCLGFDGDGPDKVTIEGVDHDKNREEAGALSSYGGDFEVIGDMGSYCVNRGGKSTLVFRKKEGKLRKAMPVILFFKSYVRAHSRKLPSGRIVQVGSYHNKVTAKPKVESGRDDRTWDMFAQQQEKQDGNKSGDPDAAAQGQAIKEPWQMTKEAYRNSHEGFRAANAARDAFYAEYARDTGDRWQTTRRWESDRHASRLSRREKIDARWTREWGRADSAHRKGVEAALRAGKPVPAEVLADYPDLKPAGSMRKACVLFLRP